jgi:hypothetical protein
LYAGAVAKAQTVSVVEGSISMIPVYFVAGVQVPLVTEHQKMVEPVVESLSVRLLGMT